MKVLGKLVKYIMFQSYPEKRTVGRKKFERNPETWKVVKRNVNYNSFVKVGSAKVVKHVSF